MRVRGVVVETDVTALLLVAFFTLPLATSTFPEQFEFWSTGEIWTAAILIGLLIFGSILVHELSHALSGLALGGKVEKIRLFIFGGLTYFREKPKSQSKDFVISVAGPLSNLTLGLIFYIGQHFSEANSVPNVVCGYLIWINIGLGIFNLLPGFPMDGGQALRSAVIVLTRRESLAALVVAISGCIVGGLLAAAAAATLVRNEWFGALWTGLIAFWIISGSLNQFWSLPNYQPRSALARLLWKWRPRYRYYRPTTPPPVGEIVRARDIMTPLNVFYPLNSSVRQFLQAALVQKLLDNQYAGVLEPDGKFYGLVTPNQARAVPPVERERLLLSHVTLPSGYFMVISAGDDLALVVKAMNTYPNRPVLVFSPEGHPVGLIGRAELERYLKAGSEESELANRPVNPYL